MAGGAPGTASSCNAPVAVSPLDRSRQQDVCASRYSQEYAGYVMPVTDPKTEVRDFWNSSPCGEIYAVGDTDEERWRRHAETRYRLEPYIRPFALFDEGTAQRILEVGVGIGADHLEWARSVPRSLAGVDLSRKAIDVTTGRLRAAGFTSDLRVADAEDLPFPDDSFDLVYSWGVLHHSPDPQRAFREAHRVLRPGGTLRAMIYHRPSFVGLLLWARYGLATGQPVQSLTSIYAHHLESPGTKGYTVAEARRLVVPFAVHQIRTAISFGDLLLGEAGQRHMSRPLSIARHAWPRPFIRRLPSLGLLLLLEAEK